MSDLRLYTTAALLVVAMVLAGWIGRRQRIGAVILALLSVAWLTVDRDWEGGVIVALGASHGITTADFVGFAGILASGWLLVRRRS